jgi:hypothetical protein
MSLGSILLTPQPLQLPLVPEKDRAVRAVQEFGARLIREVTAGGRGLGILSDALSAALADLLGELASRLGAARSSLDSLLSSIQDMFDLSGADTPAAAIQKIADTAGKIADDLTPAEIGRVLGNMLDVIETDLGLNQTRMAALFTSVTSALVDGFKADFRANPTDPGAYNRYALGSALEELLDALPFPTLPPLTRSEIVPRIVNALQSSQFDTKVGPIRDGIKYAATALSGVGGLAQFFPAEAFGPATAGAAETPQKYCWYGSWLANDFTRSVNAPSCDILTDVNFGPKLTLEVMDKIAKHSKWGSDTLQFILHAQSIEKGNFVSNLLNMVYRLVEIGINLFADTGVPTWVPWVGVPVLTFLGGLQGARFNDFFGGYLILGDGLEAQLYARWAFVVRELLMSILTLSNFDKDKFAQFLEANPAQNMTPDQKAAFDEKVRNFNHNQIDGIALAFGEIGAMIMPLILRGTDKDDYGFPDGGGSWGTQFGFWLLGVVLSIGLALAGGFGIGAAIAGEAADANRILSILSKERILGRLTFSTTGRKVLDSFRIIPIILSYLVDYLVYLFLFIENATEGGKFASKQRRTALGVTEYPGYPDHTTSPYRLPYGKGTLQQCAQGNLGIVSHTPVSFQSQVYAYDFALNNDTEIHAARAGIVADFRDDLPDGPGDTANFIQIVHDTHVAGHDFDEKGGTADSTGTANTLATMCEYLHGKHGTVTAAFAALSPAVNIRRPGSSVAGIPGGWPFAVAVDGSGSLINDPTTGKPQLIRVVRGQVIMHADNTGRSSFNHVHIDVYPTTGTLSGATPSVTKGEGSIPFVFGDDDVSGSGGVPKSLKWHESGNDS